MIVIIGLLVLIAAAVVAVLGVATNSGSAHPLGDGFAIFGQHLTGLSIGQLFLCGIIVGIVGMFGLSLLLGPFTRRLASRRSRRDLKGSQRETTDLRQDRDRLAQQLDDERSVATGTKPPSGDGVAPPDAPSAPEGLVGAPSGSRHRNGPHPDQ
jgi:hypothetical protein